MNEPTDAPGEAASVAPARQPTAAGKPRFALFIATACGLGYIPVAPGTFGSLAGLALSLVLAWIPLWDWFVHGVYWRWDSTTASSNLIDPDLGFQCALTIVIAAIGVWSAQRASKFWQQKDPQRVVIDEVSGQHLTLLLGLGVPVWWKGASAVALSSMSVYLPGASLHFDAPKWKYLLLGFILFRVFDIWKPFPARQAESLPGGWGIMADDWVAGIYAAIGLWIARAAGL
jgi:phosphatidylglycerophosphatase A